MKTNSEIHPIQAEILKELLFNPELTFSKLNKNKITNDQFNFHVKKLIHDGLLEKTEDKIYKLTLVGKEFANRFDTDKKEIEKQAKVSVKMVITREKNGIT